MISKKRIAILGFGKEGLSAANYLGVNNDVSIIDEKQKSEIEQESFKKLKAGAHFYFGGKLPERQNFDLIIRSPSIRPDHSIIKKLKKSQSTLTSSTQIFFDECPCKIIGVTGTKGKGTTATLIYEMLKTQNKDVFLAGNIGTPALDILPKLKKGNIVILELSSFQLIDLRKSPSIAVVLMITQEHLDWHTNESEYKKSKESLVSHQKKSDCAIINRDFEASFSFAKKTKAKVFLFSQKSRTNGVYLKGTKITSKITKEEEICKINDILLPGRHNLQNAMAAIATAKILKINNENIKKVLKKFKGLVHRLQYLGKIQNVKFYNDSFSTIPETTIAATDAITGPKILILGGSSKNSDFTKLAKKIIQDKSIRSLVLIGNEAKKIKDVIFKAGNYSGEIVEGATNMKEIASQAYAISKPKDTIILSPACASFDMFKNYQDRGNQFIQEVQELKSK